MALGLIDKLTNFLMPIEEVADIGREQVVSELSAAQSRKTVNLRVHTQETAGLKVLIAAPTQYEDVTIYADNLKARVSVVVNFEHVDGDLQRAIVDFLNGVCYIIKGNVQRVSDEILMYVPENVDISKELYAFSIPTYTKMDTK